MKEQRDLSASPVVLEFLRQVREDVSLHLDVGKMWIAAGCPKGSRPDDWADLAIEVGARDPQLRQVDGGAITMTHKDTVLYAIELDEQVDEAYDEFRTLSAQYPIVPMIQDPSPLTAMMTIVRVVLLSKGTMSPAAAAQNFMATLVQSVTCTGDFHGNPHRGFRDDPFRQETIVARAQRALRGEPTLWLPSAAACGRKR